MMTISHAATQRHNGRGRLSVSLRLSLRRCAAAGAILFLFTLCVFAQTPQDDRGLLELRKGDYENAFRLISGRLTQTPNDAILQRALIRVYIETGRYTEAEATAKKFLLKTPDNGAVRHELAETLAITGRYTEAIIEFE